MPANADAVLAQAANVVERQRYTELNEMVADVLGLASELVNTKKISAANQVSPRTSEFGGLKQRHASRSGVPSEWIFVGLVTADPSEQAAVMSQLPGMLAGTGTAALILASKPQWRALKVYYARGHERVGRALQGLFGLPDQNVAVLPGVGEDAWAADPDAAVFSIDDALQDLFLNRSEFEGMLRLLRRNKNLIIQGPPGVGKTFLVRRLAYALLGMRDPGRVTVVQFHQSYSYEDFMQGYRPTEEGRFVLKQGRFFEFCKETAASLPADTPVVFVIDEINRGNLSKIFGELMMLIEADKRGDEFAIPLVYSPTNSDKFSVPANVFVIGLMNTADRSLAMVDYALRRRFAFYQLRPAFNNAAFKPYLIGKGVVEPIVDLIVDRMRSLNERIASDTKNLGPGFEIGHSYFCPRVPFQGASSQWYRDVVQFELSPLLHEYWFDDPDTASEAVQALLEGVPN